MAPKMAWIFTVFRLCLILIEVVPTLVIGGAVIAIIIINIIVTYKEKRWVALAMIRDIWDIQAKKVFVVCKTEGVMFLNFFLLAVIFLFTSCYERDNLDDPSSKYYEATVSSSSRAPSSSSKIASSSSNTAYTLACDNLDNVPAIAAYTAITQPKVTCNGSTVSSDALDWPKTLNWSNPSAGEYNISVAAISGDCFGKTAQCGSLMVLASTNCEMNYKTTQIGEQTWMAENLNCIASSRKCLDDDPKCEIYGGLYNWITAMNLPTSCATKSCASRISEKHRGMCPKGWHIPSNGDWEKLQRYIENDNGCSNCAGWYLGDIGSHSWEPNEDKYGFSALGGGYCMFERDQAPFWCGSDDNRWWSSSEKDAKNAHYWYSAGTYSEAKGQYQYPEFYYLYSVRCVED